jgi:hypothetical protein
MVKTVVLEVAMHRILGRNPGMMYLSLYGVEKAGICPPLHPPTANRTAIHLADCSWGKVGGHWELKLGKSNHGQLLITPAVSGIATPCTGLCAV